MEITENDLIKISVFKHLKSKRIFTYTFNETKDLPAAAAMGENGKLYINFENFEIKDRNSKVAIIAHELLHDILDHVRRMINFLGENPKKDDVELFNIATDHIVNNILLSIDSNVFEYIDESGVNLNKYFDSSINEMSAEILYRFLKENTEAEFTSKTIEMEMDADGNLSFPSSGSSSSDSSDENNENSDNGNGDDGDDNGDNKDTNDNERNDKNNNKSDNDNKSDQTKEGKGKIKTTRTYKYRLTRRKLKTKSGKTIIDDTVLSPEDASDISKSRSSMADAYALQDAMKNAGTGTSSISAEIEMIKHPMDMKKELEKYLNTIKEGYDDITFFDQQRVNKLNLAGMTNVAMPISISRECKVFIGIDTSGSIEDKEYAEFVSILNDNVDILSGVAILNDAKIQDRINISRDKIFEMKEKLKNRKGYGGTEFDEFFEEAQKQRDIDLIIVFTDLGLYRWPPRPRQKVVWVARKTYKNTKPPYGHVIWY